MKSWRTSWSCGSETRRRQRADLRGQLRCRASRAIKALVGVGAVRYGASGPDLGRTARLSPCYHSPRHSGTPTAGRQGCGLSCWRRFIGSIGRQLLGRLELFGERLAWAVVVEAEEQERKVFCSGCANVPDGVGETWAAIGEETGENVV